VVFEARLCAQGDTDYFRNSYDGRGTLPRSLMPTVFRNLCQGFSFDVQSMLLAVGCPFFFQRAGLSPRRDVEPGQRQDQGAHTDTWLAACPVRPYLRQVMIGVWMLRLTRIR
jgi:hypothetical protein